LQAGKKSCTKAMFMILQQISTSSKKKLPHLQKLIMTMPISSLSATCVTQYLYICSCSLTWCSLNSFLYHYYLQVKSFPLIEVKKKPILTEEVCKQLIYRIWYSVSITGGWTTWHDTQDHRAGNKQFVVSWKWNVQWQQWTNFYL